ncbi:molybdopterin biosynthesis MoaE protein [Alkalidesulfovibrio alkalitolerans DSM 16529]|jgi:molybdopterin synthase catalytic subunit|uniref:Molybdopterin synthase catalytic subunit n=1 Tax=Alkalidesulfovibrio alkalitolerans DSM 16529 TaxID=1121439 RepID=S7UR70_9BACT|nr:molybdenum cofactor biosynthesis protein MoaE [Alkalidesulfovibrio alkalitolerans]EPR34768.1 molybdopterin biosynthesis MoaE protein [Alkalidesulfovibrio alkalitolerans DSM 16529]
MDISKTIAELKKDPEFQKNVGMVLVHNGVVRGWSRAGHETVEAVDIHVDRDTVEAIRRDIEAKPGIWRAVAEANDGLLFPGDDVLFLLVAGDIRENVKPALAEFLDRVKAEAVHKKEHVAAPGEERRQS